MFTTLPQRSSPVYEDPPLSHSVEGEHRWRTRLGLRLGAWLHAGAADNMFARLETANVAWLARNRWLAPNELDNVVHMTEQFEPDEVEHIRAALIGGSDAVCPRCDGRFDRTDVPPRNDVSYVRDRIWLICATCDAGLVLDRPKTPPG